MIIGAAGAVLAQEEPAVIAPEETITISDLGVSEPTVLPTNPFYFFKEIGRGLQSFITFNPVAKAELELKFANEKAAETKKITETQPANTQAIQRALENYQRAQENLRKRFEALKETSQNPKVDELLNKFTDRVVKHEKLFDEISFKFQGKEDIAKAVRDTMAGSEDLIGEASKKDDAAKFVSRLERVLLEEKGGDLKHARSLEIIGRFGNKAPSEIKNSLERLREEFSEKLEIDIKDLIEKKGEDALKEKITNTPGDFARRSVIIEEIKERTKNQLGQSLQRITEHLETKLLEDKNISEKAGEQIGKAEKMIQEAEKKFSVVDSAKIPAAAINLLRQAREHLTKAKLAFGEKKYSQAFGQARSAEVLARNAIKSIGEKRPETENFEKHLKELEEKIGTYRNMLKERGFTEEQNKDAFELLNNAVLHLGYAKESFAKGDLEKTKLHISHVKGFLSKLSNILEGKHSAERLRDTAE